MYTTVQMFGVSRLYIIINEKMKLVIQQGCITLIKIDSQDMYNVLKDVYLKCCFNIFAKES